MANYSLCCDQLIFQCKGEGGGGGGGGLILMMQIGDRVPVAIVWLWISGG